MDLTVRRRSNPMVRGQNPAALGKRRDFVDPGKKGTVMYSQTPGVDAPSPEQMQQTSGLRHYAIGLMIHVTGIVLLQVFGLSGMLAHIMVAAVCQCLEQIRRQRR
jgi:hypothetical protein